METGRHTERWSLRTARAALFVIALVLSTTFVQDAGAQAETTGPTAEDQALFDEAALQVQAELDLLLQLGGDDDPAIYAELAEVDAAGVAMLERFGPIIDYAPRIRDLLGPFPNGVDNVGPPSTRQRTTYEDVVEELRDGLPKAHQALVGGAPIADDGTVPNAPPRPQPPLTPTPATESNLDVSAILLTGTAVAFVFGAVGAFVWRRRSDDHAGLVELAMTDELTQLSNRRRLEADLRSHSERTGELTVAMIDIDLFKKLNDRFGHVVGDHVLRETAAVIADNVRESDVVYRYGGEEFCVLLPDATDDEAMGVLERVRMAIEAMELDEVDDGVTVSAGLARGASGSGGDTLRDADSALYEAKRTGRNRVVQYAPV